MIRSSSPVNSSMITTALALSPNRRSSGLTAATPLQTKEEGPTAPPGRPEGKQGPKLSLELVPEADLELALVVAHLAALLERRRIAGAGAPRRVGPVDPIEHVERLEVDGGFVAPRHGEGLGDAHVEPLVGDRFVRVERAPHVAVAAGADGSLARREEDDVAERRARRQGQDARQSDAE